MIVGTAGHIEHGKTALVRALTGVDTDRLKEEKARGLSVDLGFAYLPMPEGGVLGLVDVPGHERFVHNMLAGAAGIDFALLVVADAGIMPQTIEHLAIVGLLGVSLGAVAITKSDRVDARRLAEVREEIADLLARTALHDAPMFPVSSTTGAGIADLRAHLFAAAARSSHPARGRFRLAVDRSFTLPEAGTVVTGTVLSGGVAVGDEVVISPSGMAARVAAIHAQNRAAERGQAGDRCALSLAGAEISKDAISRGNMVLDPALHAPANRIDAKLRVLATETRPLTQWMPVRLHHAAAETGARIVLLGDDPLPPGGEAFVQIITDQPIAAAAGDRFVLRDTTAQRTVGGGVFIDLRGPARKRRTPERMAQLEAGAIADAGDCLGALLDAAGYIDFTAFVRDRALSAGEREALIQRLGLVRLSTPQADHVVAPSTWFRLKTAIHATLTAFHAAYPNLPGMALERLRLKVEPRLPAPVFAMLLQGLAHTGELALNAAWARLPDHAARLSPADEAAWRKISPYIGGESRFQPPRVRDIAGYTGIAEPDVRRVFKLIERMGRVDEIAHDHFFLRGAVAEIVEIMASLAAATPDDGFAAAQLRDHLGNGRKTTVQILEFFDRHGITIRHGDLRRINTRRLDLFGRSSDDLPAPARIARICANGRASFPVGRPDFKSGRGRKTVFGGFDSHSLPPDSH